MALIPGDAACTTGLSRRIYDALLAGGEGFSEGAAGKAMAHAIAVAVVDEITANATVAATVPGTGLIAPTGGGPVTGIASGTGTVS